MEDYKVRGADLAFDKAVVHYVDLIGLFKTAHSLLDERPRLSGRVMVENNGLGPVFGAYGEGKLFHLTVGGVRVTPEKALDLSEHAMLTRNQALKPRAKTSFDY